MKRFILLITLILTVGSVTLAEAQNSWDEIEYPPLNNFEKPDVATFELDNGIQFYLVEDHELPLINVRVIVQTGSFLVPGEQAGLSSITGTVMRTGGITSMTGDELDEFLENRAASITTSIGLASGSASMSVLEEDFDDVLPVFVDVLQNPAFSQERIDLAKTQMSSNISRRNDQQAAIASREFTNLIYGRGTVFSRYPEYETVNTITRDDLVELHASSFDGENLMIGLVGDFTISEMRQKLEQAFADYPAGEETTLEFPEVDYEYQHTINFVDKRDVNQSYILMGHIGGLRENPDYAKLQVMNRVLSDGFSGRLMQVVRSQMGLAYSVFGNYGSNNFYPGTFNAGVMTQSATTGEAIEAVIQQIQRLQDEPVSAEELEQTKERFLNSLVFQYDSRASVLNEVMTYDYVGLPSDTFDRLVEEIREVTIEDVQDVAQEYLRPDALQILVVGNGGEIGDQLEQFGDVNEIDISIPEPGSEEDSEMGDAELGREWIERMSEALLPGGGVDTVTMESESTVNTPQGMLDIGTISQLDFVNEHFITDLTTPMGAMQIEVSDDTAILRAGGQEQQLPPAQASQTRAELERHYLNLARNYETMDVEYIGEAELDDQMLIELRINLGSPVTLFLDMETAFPSRSISSQLDPATGQRVQTEMHFDDWRVVDEVAVAYSTITLVGGEEQSSTTVTSHLAE